MNNKKHYFFCGIGGSGMLPLAMILAGQGHEVKGSDRSLDQGRTSAKFDYLRAQGIDLFPQDGSGLTSKSQVFVASAAVEDTVPDVQAALKLDAVRLDRAQLLSELFNAAPKSIGVAGTSGKSTTTGMIGWILHDTGHAPTIMNGAVMKNFVSEDAPFASAVVGEGDVFVSEVDESDGSIARYTPYIALVNNVALDHKTMDELRALFKEFVGKSEIAVLNLDNAETAILAENVLAEQRITYGIELPFADLIASHLEPLPEGINFTVTERASGATAEVKLHMPGRHNVSNALAALGAARGCGVSLEAAADSLSRFEGIKRRLEYVGTSHDITVIDDFGHNPDKIAASLSTLHDFDGRLIVMFQPHGFGPLKLMKDEFINCFSNFLFEGDILLMPEPVYFGGTVDRSVTNTHIVEGVVAKDRQAHALTDRKACGDKILELAKPGDRIVIMGARDDTLSTFAEGLLDQLSGPVSKEAIA